MRLQLALDHSNVAHVRSTVCQYARDVGLPQSRIDDVAVAVSEAVANAMAAHTQQGSRDRVQVAAHVEGREALEVTVADQGGGFELADDASPGAPTGEGPMEGGWGITLMQALADDLDFVAGHGTVVRMRFALA